MCYLNLSNLTMLLEQNGKNHFSATKGRRNLASDLTESNSGLKLHVKPANATVNHLINLILRQPGSGYLWFF